MASLWLCLALAILSASPTESKRLLYKHMANNGDTVLDSECDVCDVKVQTTNSYSVFGTAYTDIFVTDRGYLSFGSSFMEITPIPFFQSAFPTGVLVAPLWEDNYQLSAIHTLRASHIWYRESTSEFDLTMTEKILADQFSGCGGDVFTPTAVFIVTYQRMSSFCDHETYCRSCFSPDCDDDYDYKRDLSAAERPFREHLDVVRDNVCEDTYGQNGYQVAIATDGTESYAIFNYADVEWEFCDVYSLALFNAGDGVRYWSHPDTGQAGLGVALTTGSNVDRKGRWVYKISDLHIKDPSCTDIS